MHKFAKIAVGAVSCLLIGVAPAFTLETLNPSDSFATVRAKVNANFIEVTNAISSLADVALLSSNNVFTATSNTFVDVYATTYIGQRLGTTNTGAGATGSRWMAIGDYAGYTSDGDDWLAAGSFAGYGVTNDDWVALGLGAAFQASGDNFTAIGESAGYDVASGGSWTAIGASAGREAIGESWLAAGSTAGFQAIGTNWMALGDSAANNAVGDEWLAAGFLVAANASGDGWVAIGPEAGTSANGLEWTALGSHAGDTSSSGDRWTAIGAYAGQGVAAGSDNWTALGYNAGGATGSEWVAIGPSAGLLAAGSAWSALGKLAGRSAVVTNSLMLGNWAGRSATGSGQVFIDSYTSDPGAGSATNNMIWGDDGTLYLGRPTESVTLRGTAYADVMNIDTIIPGSYIGSTNPALKQDFSYVSWNDAGSGTTDVAGANSHMVRTPRQFGLVTVAGEAQTVIGVMQAATDSVTFSGLSLGNTFRGTTIGGTVDFPSGAQGASIFGQVNGGYATNAGKGSIALVGTGDNSWIQSGADASIGLGNVTVANRASLVAEGYVIGATGNFDTVHIDSTEISSSSGLFHIHNTNTAKYISLNNSAYGATLVLFGSNFASSAKGDAVLSLQDLLTVSYLDNGEQLLLESTGIKPSTSGIFDLGTSTNLWKDVHASTGNFTRVNIADSYLQAVANTLHITGDNGIVRIFTNLYPSADTVGTLGTPVVRWESVHALTGAFDSVNSDAFNIPDASFRDQSGSPWLALTNTANFLVIGDETGVGAGIILYGSTEAGGSAGRVTITATNRIQFNHSGFFAYIDSTGFIPNNSNSVDLGSSLLPWADVNTHEITLPYGTIIGDASSSLLLQGTESVGSISLANDDASAGVGLYGSAASGGTRLQLKGPFTEFQSGVTTLAILDIAGFQPGASNTYSLGSTSNWWSDVYADTGHFLASTIFLGDVALSATNGQLVVTDGTNAPLVTVTEAPSNGTQYARQDNAWAAVAEPITNTTTIEFDQTVTFPAITVGGTLIDGSVSTISVANVEFDTDFIPTVSNSFDIGSEVFPLRSIYASNGVFAAMTVDALSTDVLTLTPTTQTYAVGTLHYDAASKGHIADTGYTDVRLNVGREFHVEFYNASASTISNGVVVSITGATNGYLIGTPFDPLAEPLADAEFLGITTVNAGAPTGEVSLATLMGDVSMDTSAYAVGDVLWATTNGATTDVPPLYPDVRVKIGHVMSVGASGKIYVHHEHDERDRLDKSYSFTSASVGASPAEGFFAGGFYDFASTDANLNQGALTVAYGNANVAYSAHAAIVASGAGTVDTGVVGLRVVGTSIDDEGNRTASATNIISADITTLVADTYYETVKYNGTVTFELYVVSGAPTTYSLDFNYGFAKYEDFGNVDFTITDIEAVGLAGAADTIFDIELLHHKPTGWTYAATGFIPGNGFIASWSTDMAPEDNLDTGLHFAYKRDNLAQYINGAGEEGILFRIQTGSANSVEYMDMSIQAVLETVE